MPCGFIPLSVLYYSANWVAYKVGEKIERLHYSNPRYLPSATPTTNSLSLRALGTHLRTPSTQLLSAPNSGAYLNAFTPRLRWTNSPHSYLRPLQRPSLSSRKGQTFLAFVLPTIASSLTRSANLALFADSVSLPDVGRADYTNLSNVCVSIICHAFVLLIFSTI